MEENIFYSTKDIVIKIVLVALVLSLLLNIFMLIRLKKYKNVLYVTETLLQNEQSRLQKYINGEEEQGKEKILVHISGAVKNPGVYEFTEEVRLFEVIDKAGGSLATADLNSLNLAQTVSDEAKIYVPKKGEKPTQIVTNNNQSNTNNSKININTASQEQLKTLTGIGDSKASDIITYRKKKGPFKKIEDIMLVKGIGPSTYDKIKSIIIVK